jgi:HEAT repeat protein
MQSLGFVQLAVLIMVGLNLLMVALTLGVKALGSFKVRWKKSKTQMFEPALDESVISAKVSPELKGLNSWEQDLLATLIIEYMGLLRGTERERLAQLAVEVGLVKRYFGKLGSRRRWQRARAAENLGYLGGPDAVGSLKELLADSDETIRAVAARALARIGTSEAARALAGTLDDPSGLTRVRIAENLARVGSLAVEPLIEILTTRKRRRSRAPIMAAQVLGNLRAAEARPALRWAICHGENVDLKAQAARALGKIGNTEDVPTLLELCEDEEWPVRAQAANSLGMIGESSTIPTLQRLTTDQEWWVRLNATRALANMGRGGELALLEVLEGPDRFARHRAAATLEARGITRRMVGELAAPDKKGERARRTIQAIIQSGVTKHLRYLTQTMPDGENRHTLETMLEDADES